MPIVFDGRCNLFTCDVQTIVNTVNLVGVMGAGIAKEYKRRYPKQFVKYAIACNSGNFTIGKLLLQHLDGGRLGLCFPTKKHWRNGSQLDWIELGLQKFRQTYKQCGITSIAFPPLGCGNGGLNYERDVKPLMYKYLSDLDIPVFICRGK